METQLMDEFQEEQIAETPEDVAVLYSWANLHGAKYRDFSASRREYRAQIRHRAAEELRQAELKAQAEAEAAAAAADKAAKEAEEAAKTPETYSPTISREDSLRAAEEAVRIAAAERLEAARRAEAAALAEVIARREEREIAEAHASAQKQAARYQESEQRRRELAGPQPHQLVPGQISDPYVTAQGETVDDLYSPNLSLNNNRRGESIRSSMSFDSEDRVREALLRAAERSESRPEVRIPQGDPEVRRIRQGFRPDESSGMRPVYGADGRPSRTSRSSPRPASINYAREVSGEFRAAEYRAVELRAAELRRQDKTRQSQQAQTAPVKPVREAKPAPVPEPTAGPAWLYESQPLLKAYVPPPSGGSSVADTLQHSKEVVASRWFALKGAFQPGEEAAPPEPARRQDTRTPVLAVFSLAGGVGKTSLVATLGRALASMGEKVLLVDTTAHGLLPFYFGASELRPGVVRTFSPPVGNSDAPIALVSFEAGKRSSQADVESNLTELVTRNLRGNHRLLLDLSPATGWAVTKVAAMDPTVLIPVAPDMNSVISLQSVEAFFHEITDHEGRPLQPYYVINQFDASLPLHLDVREVLRRQLGDRLLPFVIRRSPAVSEALAEGMTVVDYAPDAPVAEDYLNIAAWLRSVSAPATAGLRNARWSER